MSGAEDLVSSNERLPKDLGVRLIELEHELEYLAGRLNHVVNVGADFEKVRRGKTYTIYGTWAWDVAISERDMVVIDLASWAKAFYSPGGFWRKVQASALRAFDVNWKYKNEPGHFVDMNRDARRDAFTHLFPSQTGSIPKPADIDALVDRLCAEFDPLLSDRSDNRAHKYERGKKSAALLPPVDVATHLANCQKLLRSARLLTSNSSFGGHQIEVKEKDAQATNLVDLILLGDINWICNTLKRIRPHPAGYFWAWRPDFYAALHAAHDAHGGRGDFNDRNLFDTLKGTP